MERAISNTIHHFDSNRTLNERLLNLPSRSNRNKYTTLNGDVAIGLCVLYMTCKRELVGTHEFKPWRSGIYMTQIHVSRNLHDHFPSVLSLVLCFFPYIDWAIGNSAADSVSCELKALIFLPGFLCERVRGWKLEFSHGKVSDSEKKQQTHDKDIVKPRTCGAQFIRWAF